MIDFSALALSPNESRAARNYLGLSQTQVAEQSGLAAHKLKRFEAGNYVPDNLFLGGLRDFYEQQGFNFHDEDAPGAKAKARGDVVPAGVAGPGTAASSPDETSGSLSEQPGKLPRPQAVNLQFLRISPTLKGDQIDRIFDCIESNEAEIDTGSSQVVTSSFFGDGPTSASQASAVALLRRLAENGLLFARLMGRDQLVPEFEAGNALPKVVAAKTIGDLLRIAMSDMQRAVVEGDKDAQARRKAHKAPEEVFEALVG